MRRQAHYRHQVHGAPRRRAEGGSITEHGPGSRGVWDRRSSRVRGSRTGLSYSPRSHTRMSNYNLSYGISKRTPASPKVLKEILDAQAAVNRTCTWTHERLSLAAPRE